MKNTLLGLLLILLGALFGGVIAAFSCRRSMQIAYDAFVMEQIVSEGRLAVDQYLELSNVDTSIYAMSRLVQLEEARIQNRNYSEELVGDHVYSLAMSYVRLGFLYEMKGDKPMSQKLFKKAEEWMSHEFWNRDIRSIEKLKAHVSNLDQGLRAQRRSNPKSK